MASIIALDDEGRGRRYTLNATLLIGRGPYNHLVIDDARISRQHAKIAQERGGYVVYDLNSVNGTSVNDEPVHRRVLKANDVVRFGPFSFRFVAASNVSAGTLAAPPRRSVEVRTIEGMAPLAEIIGSVDASTSDLLGGLTELEDASRRLQTLYMFMQTMSSTLDPMKTLGSIARAVLEMFSGAEVVSVHVIEPDAPPPVVCSRLEDVVETAAIPPQVLDEVLQGRAILTAPAEFGVRVKRTGGLNMYAPLAYRGTPIGVLHVQGTGALFGQHDLDLLSTAAVPATLAFQNARMHEESLRQEQLKHDLALAEQIQKSFLPRELPNVAGMEFVTEYRPAHSVGGDFYDVFWLTPKRLGIFIGDVSGKGVSAALLMARFTSDLRVAARTEPGPARVIAHVNRQLVAREQHDIFITAIYLTLDVETGDVVMANAGHLPPYICRRGGRVERIDEGTTSALGLFEDDVFEPALFRLGAGDSMVLVTDGILEATRADGELFGFDRIEQSLVAGGWRASDVAKQLMTDVRNHVGQGPRRDDLTMVVCGFTESARMLERPWREPPPPNKEAPRGAFARIVDHGRALVPPPERAAAPLPGRGEPTESTPPTPRPVAHQKATNWPSSKDLLERHPSRPRGDHT